MKKYLLIMAAFLAFACSKDNDSKKDETHDGVEFVEHEDHFMYDGAKYRTKVAHDGSKWMIDPLHFVPEGKKVSDDATDGNGIWSPIDQDKKPLNDAESVAKFGYCYDLQTALATEITPENCAKLEGVQGICPKGWHVPTKAEFDSAFGPKSPLYDADDYKGVHVTKFCEAGFNWSFSSYVMRNTIQGKGKYMYFKLDEKKCNQKEWFGNNGLGFMISSSTPANPVKYDKENPELVKNIQFYGLMSTFSSKFPEGKLSMAFNNLKAANQLRCVKDAK